MLLMIRTPQSVNAWSIDPAMKSVNENDYCFLATGHHALYALPGLVWQVGELQSSPELLAADALAIPSAFRIQGEFADTVKGHRQVDLQSPGPVQDRKSTRLNSSHVKISYAVFCLKKKTLRTHRVPGTGARGATAGGCGRATAAAVARRRASRP